MRRQDRQTNKEEALEIIKESLFAVVSAVDEKGQPYSTPVSPVLYRGAIYFHSAVEGGARSRAIEAHPFVSVAFVARNDILGSRYSVDYRSALVRGTCSRVTDPEEAREALKALSAHYAPENDPAATEAYIASAFDRVTVWKVAVEEISGKARNPARGS